MNQFVVDFGDAAVAPGDEVVLFGPGDAGEPTAQEWADALGTMSYDIVTRFAGRVPRSYSGVTRTADPVLAGRPGDWARTGELMASWRRITGVAGLAAGAAVAAGAGAVLAAEKVAVGRLRLRPDPEADEPFGQLHGRASVVLADDGVPLHVEINGPDDGPGHDHLLPRLRAEPGRLALPAPRSGRRGRLVFWDQRGHGRSGACSRGTTPPSASSGRTCTRC